MNQDEENSRESKLEKHWRNLDSDDEASRNSSSVIVYGELLRIAGEIAGKSKKLLAMNEDIVQDCAIRLLPKEAERRDQESVEGFLRAVLKNKGLDHLRRLQKRRARSLDAIPSGIETDDVEIQLADNRDASPQDVIEVAEESAGSSRQIEELEAHLVAELDLLPTTMRRDAARSTEQGIREILDLKLERSSVADLLEAEKSSGDGDEGRARARIHTRHSRARRKMIEHIETRAEQSPSERPWSLLLDLIQRGLTENSA